MCGEQPRGRCRWWQRQKGRSRSILAVAVVDARRRGARERSPSRHPIRESWSRRSSRLIPHSGTPLLLLRSYRSRIGTDEKEEVRKREGRSARTRLVRDTSRPLFTRVQRGASRLLRKNVSSRIVHEWSTQDYNPALLLSLPSSTSPTWVVVLVPVLVIVSSAVVQLLLLPDASYTGGGTVQQRRLT